MTLAPAGALAAAHSQTGASVWVYGQPDVTGVLLNLPLTAEGEIALILDELDRSHPDPDHICAPGEPVSAMYIWFTGGLDLRSQAAVMRVAFAWRDGFYANLRAYSRAVSKGGERGLTSLRFAPLEKRPAGLMYCPKRKQVG